AAAVKVEYDDSAPTEVASIQKRTAIFQQVLARVGAIPGVEAVGITDYLPLGQNRAWGTPLPKGLKRPDKAPPSPLVYVVTPGYFRAMGTALRGRDFTWDDGPKSGNVVIINKSFAHYLAEFAKWPNGDVIGHEITNGDQDLHIIGITGDVHEESVEGETGWQIYYPTTQRSPNSAELVMRTTLPPPVLANSVLRTLRDLNPSQPAAEFRPIQMLVDHANSPRRFFMLLVAAFATLGLLLAALGIYGVISYSVTQRTQEIGIRMALGSTMGRVQTDVIRRTLRLAAAGVLIGTAASFAVARLIASLLFATSPSDAATYIGMALALLLVAVVSGYIPARRASRISPLVALRSN
ncbi:MAG TPA: FtsX-like permease family protein, partial [Terracidiphilus sp.]|nr:FtsX-like permease family protein [Terracidiphilus sp.]